MVKSNNRSCPRLLKCPMVVDSAGKFLTAGEKIRSEFCDRNHHKCARYLVIRSLGGEFVPPDLQPDQVKRARDIISSNQDLL